MKYRIELDVFDLGQAIDGLDARAEAWEKTARYHRTGESPEEIFIVEECRDADDADKIASHCRLIIAKIRKQHEDQS